MLYLYMTSNSNIAKCETSSMYCFRAFAIHEMYVKESTEIQLELFFSVFLYYPLQPKKTQT